MIKHIEYIVMPLLFFAYTSSYAREISDVPVNLDFALHLSRTDVTLQYPDNTVDNTIKQLGVTVHQPIYPHMDFALSAGYLGLTQSERLLTEGMNLQGYYAGLGLRATAFQRGMLAVRISSSYTFNHVQDEYRSQSVSIESHETEFGLDITLAMSKSFSVMAGTTLGWIDGEQRAWGTVSRTESIGEDTHDGHRVGLDLDVGSGGHIGFLIQRGLHEGHNIYFQRIF